MDIQKNIKLLRIAKSYNQEYMAKKLKISQSGYAKLERGQTEITLNRLQQLAEIFGMPVYEIINLGKGGESSVSQILTPDEYKYQRHDYAPASRSYENELISELKEKVNLYKQLYELTKDELEKYKSKIK